MSCPATSIPMLGCCGCPDFNGGLQSFTFDDEEFQPFNFGVQSGTLEIGHWAWMATLTSRFSAFGPGAGWHYIFGVVNQFNFSLSDFITLQEGQNSGTFIIPVSTTNGACTIGRGFLTQTNDEVTRAPGPTVHLSAIWVPDPH